MAHSWTENDEKVLRAVVTEMLPLQEYYRQAGKTQRGWWDAVAGRMWRADRVLTGRACAERWRLLRRADAQQPAYDEGQPDAWGAVAAQVEQYERDVLQRVETGLEQLACDVAGLQDDMRAVRTALNHVGSDVVKLLRMW